MSEFTTQVGRLVSGHPMTLQHVKDDQNKPKYESDGVTAVTEYFMAIAIKKGAEQHWNQTPWGQQIHQVGSAGWPNGEIGRPDFAWKMIDGDSTIPNKKGNKPADREGFPGHWIMNLKTRFPIQCCNNGVYDPLQAIKNEKEIKRGDYVRAVVAVKDNAPSQSPGVYLNPKLFELVRAGVEIISENAPDAAASFGATAAVMPEGALVDNAIAQPGAAGNAPPPPSTTPNPPVTEFLDPANMLINYQGKQYTEAQLQGFNWTPQQIQTARDAS